MFRFLRPNLIQALRRPLPKVKHFARNSTLATAAVTLSALALHTEPELGLDSHPPLSSLIRSYFVFTLCSIPSLVDASPVILRSLSNIPLLRNASEAFLRVTFFNQFVGAETVDACVPLLHSLRRSNQGALFCYSVEQLRSNPALDASQRALESILHSIDVAGDFEDSLSSSVLPHTTSKGTWVAIKLSTLLLDTELDHTRNALWALSEWIVRKHHNTSSRIDANVTPFPGVPAAQDFQLFLDQVQLNDVDEAQHIQPLVGLYSNLRKICTRAQARGIRVTIDAEETWLQPAIDLYSILLMQEFNSFRLHDARSLEARPLIHDKVDPTIPVPQPLVYTTLQAYLVRAPAFLEFLLAHARENEYALGVKLVRGAYVDAEVAEHAHAAAHSASQSSSPSAEMVRLKGSSKSISPDQHPPTYPSKEATDAAYDACARVLVEEVARDVERGPVHSGTGVVPRIAVLFGTHNWRSVRLVLDEILRLGLAEEVVDSNKVEGKKDGSNPEKKLVLSEEIRQRISMAQLYGMSDSLAAYIVDRTQTRLDQSSSPFVIRYMPYGPLRDVMPYLARRAVENRSVLGPSNVSVSDVRPETREAGGAVEERKRIGRMIWARVIEFWRF